jgi:hypothetical protein
MVPEPCAGRARAAVVRVALIPGALYEHDGGDGRFRATALTRGPWNPEHQHAGPPAALLAREAERVSAIVAGQTTRLSFDILGPVPVGAVEVAARILRPGRRVELVEATLSAGGDPRMRLTAWRMRAEETPDIATPEPPPPPRQSGRDGAFEGWPGVDEVAYKDALDWRWIEGAFNRPGPATVWSRLKFPVVAGEDPTPLGRLLVMADAASGVSARLDWDEWLFVNLDLGIYLERPPRGEWMAMDAQTRIGDAGAGLCTSVLSDGLGRVGVSTQSLLVAPRRRVSA